ncbi:MAG: peptidylprolyl isomerase [Planctomycetia bacterium]|nr:peptidylprolyl isomerase [Planctomycetia bacterium]
MLAPLIHHSAFIIRHSRSLVAFLALSSAAFGQTFEALRTELETIGALKPSGTVAAKVDGEPVDVSDVNRLLKMSLRDRPLPKDAIPMLEATALDQVINRRLITLFLDRNKISVTEADIDKTIAEREKAFVKQGTPLAEALGQNGLTAEEYRDQVEWELRWAKYLRSYVTDAELEKYFQAHHQDFDGTEVRVSHILFRPSGEVDEAKVKELTDRAGKLRDEIIGQLSTFAEAAKRYSDGPSRAHGGDIGFIPRHGIMDEAFSQAAFSLKKGEICLPVVSSFGVHLIQCTDVRPGKKTWRDVRKELEPTLKRDAFTDVAEKMRKTTPIEYTGAVSYKKPGSTEIVKAGADDEAERKAGDEESK